MPIDKLRSLKDRVFVIADDQEFNDVAIDIFHFQSTSNPTYRSFLKQLDRPLPRHWSEIPCLPISVFKHHELRSVTGPVDQIFKSSGTSGSGDSSHFISDINIYERSFRDGFEKVYGRIEEWCVIGLLPSYLERKDSSLIYMVNDLIKRSDHDKSGFYLHDHDALSKVLTMLKQSGQRTILIGVTYALLDFVESFPMSFPELVVLETGGMKGRRKEIIREEVHKRLKRGFDVDSVHSEYGMTELLSQAYSKGEGIFSLPPWMKIQVRDIQDPLTMLGPGLSGGLNIIDLANIESCSFIASDDLGKLDAQGRFEVLGRFDASDIRGCSLMV